MYVSFKLEVNIRVKLPERLASQVTDDMEQPTDEMRSFASELAVDLLTNQNTSIGGSDGEMHPISTDCDMLQDYECMDFSG